MTVLLTAGWRGKVNKCTAEKGAKFMKNFAVFAEVARTAVVASSDNHRRSLPRLRLHCDD